MTRRGAVALLGGAGLVAASMALGRLPNLSREPVTFLLLFGGAFGCYALGAWALHSMRGPVALGLVLVVAAAARLALLPSAPTLSTDAYRYVWDARVAAAGLSPYAYPPAAPELAHLREGAIYPRLNHPTWQTIYPPGAEAFFQAVHAIRPGSVIAMKAALGLAEALGVALLLGWLSAQGIPPVRAVIYAWNPLVMVEGWGSGHLDAMIVPAVVGAAWAHQVGRQAVSGGLLAAGALLKLYPAALLPLLLGPGFVGALAGFVVVLGLGYAPVALAGLGSLGSLPRYLREEYFNPGVLRSAFELAGVDMPPGLGVAVVAVWIVAVAVWGRQASWAARAVALAGGCLLLSPNVFPWYALWLVAFLAAAPSLPWIGFTGALALAYTFFLHDPWSIPWWARALEAAPLAAGAAWWLGRRAPRGVLAERSA